MQETNASRGIFYLTLIELGKARGYAAEVGLDINDRVQAIEATLMK